MAQTIQIKHPTIHSFVKQTENNGPCCLFFGAWYRDWPTIIRCVRMDVVVGG